MVKQTIAGAVLVFGLLACTGGPGDGPQGGEGPADATSRALGEAACATQPLASSDVVTSPGFHCAFDNSRTSPHGFYHGDGCPNQYVVEVQNLPASNRAFSMYADWQQRPGDAATCARARTTVAAYVHDAGGWRLYGASTTYGSWVDYGPSGFCDFVGGGSFGVPASSGFDAVRIAGAAFTVETDKSTPYNYYRPVTAGIRGGQVC